MSQSKIAAQLFTVREFTNTPEDIAKTMKKVKEIGYDAVQLSALGEIDVQELKKIVDGEGLTVCATHVGFDYLQNETEKAADYHNTLGCRYPAIGGLPGEYRNGPGFKEFAGLATEVGKKLAEYGLSFGYHNHSFELIKYDGRTGLEIFYENSDPEFVKAEIDTYWIQHGGGDPAAWIRKMKGRIPYVHFKDMVMGEEKKQLFAEIGEGNLNWDGLLDACRECDVEWYIIEQDICPGNPFDSLRKSLENLKAMGVE